MKYFRSKNNGIYGSYFLWKRIQKLFLHKFPSIQIQHEKKQYKLENIIETCKREHLFISTKKKVVYL